jgi:hypothetical protein
LQALVESGVLNGLGRILGRGGLKLCLERCDFTAGGS